MRVLALSWAVSDYRGGGEPVASYELLRHLAEAGVTVDVVTPEYDAKTPLPDGVRVHEARGGPRSGMTGASKRAMIREVQRLHRQHEYAVTHLVSQFTSFPVHWHPFAVSGCWVPPPGPGDVVGPQSGPLGTLARALATGPVTHRVDVLRDVAYALDWERRRGWSLGRTLRDADVVILRESEGVAHFKDRARRVEYIPFGVDPEWFPFNADAREPVVLYAGNLRAYKNPAALVRAFARVAEERPDARLRIAGAGEDLPALEALARELGLADRVAFLGHVPRPLLREELARAAVFALPSRESFGQVALEALACGTPVVASPRVAGAHDYLTDGENGWFAEPGDADAFAGKLLEALAFTGDERARVAHAARAAAERFSWREIAREHVALYESL